MIDFSVTRYAIDDARSVVSLAGEIDICTAPAAERELEAAIECAGQEVVIDLTDTTLIDATFLSVIARGHKAINRSGGLLSVRSSDPTFLKIFSITGLDRVVAIHAAGQSTELAPCSG